MGGTDLASEGAKIAFHRNLRLSAAITIDRVTRASVAVPKKIPAIVNSCAVMGSRFRSTFGVDSMTCALLNPMRDRMPVNPAMIRISNAFILPTISFWSVVLGF